MHALIDRHLPTPPHLHATREVQRVVVTEGQIYLAALPRAVQDFLRCDARWTSQANAPHPTARHASHPLSFAPAHSTVPLRASLEQCLKPLAFHGVPVTLFDEGYGEALMQILALSTPGLTGPEGFLPPNVRLVSNFFRSGPDGVVNGFSFPPVHELNRNMTTARAFRSGMMLGMQQQAAALRAPPNALVLGGSLDDLALAQGGGVERQVLAVGFLDTDADFLPNLPRFLEAYDAVILGDGGLQYAAHVVEQIVGSA